MVYIKIKIKKTVTIKICPLKVFSMALLVVFYSQSKGGDWKLY